MNRDDVIRWAREAGFESHDISLNFPRELERFAALVAAAEREAGQKWFDAVTAQHKAEILAEREACAKVVEDTKEWKGGGWVSTLCHHTKKAIAAAIRARGQA